MSDLVGNPEDRFSQNEAHLKLSVCTIGIIGTNCITNGAIGRTLSNIDMSLVPMVELRTNTLFV